MDLDAYVAEHRGEWRRLGAAERRYKLTAAEADELVLLYQRVATHLSVVRSRTPDPALVAELSRLVLGARSALTGPSRFDWRRGPAFLRARRAAGVLPGRAGGGWRAASPSCLVARHHDLLGGGRPRWRGTSASATATSRS